MTTINFPKCAEGIIFVRGSGMDSTDKPLEINGIKMMKQWLWVKGSFIVQELEKKIIFRNLEFLIRGVTICDLTKTAPLI